MKGGLVGDEVDLLGTVVFLLWSDECDFDLEFVSSFFGPCFNGFPVNVSGALRDYCNACGCAAFFGFAGEKCRRSGNGCDDEEVADFHMLC